MSRRYKINIIFLITILLLAVLATLSSWFSG